MAGIRRGSMYLSTDKLSRAESNPDRNMEFRKCTDCHGDFLIMSHGSEHALHFILCADCLAKQLKREMRAGKRPVIRCGTMATDGVTGQRVFVEWPYDEKKVRHSMEEYGRKRKNLPYDGRFILKHPESMES